VKGIAISTALARTRRKESHIYEQKNKSKTQFKDEYLRLSPVVKDLYRDRGAQVYT
jgi:hypothetical protein